MNMQTQAHGPDHPAERDALRRELAVWKHMYDRLSFRMLALERERDRLDHALSQRDREMGSMAESLAGVGEQLQGLRRETGRLQRCFDELNHKLDGSGVNE